MSCFNEDCFPLTECTRSYSAYIYKSMQRNVLLFCLVADQVVSVPLKVVELKYMQLRVRINRTAIHFGNS